jgi:hypothetical protein
LKWCSHCNCRPLYSSRSYYDLPVTCHFRLELMEIKKMHAVYRLHCGLWMYVVCICWHAQTLPLPSGNLDVLQECRYNGYCKYHKMSSPSNSLLLIKRGGVELQLQTTSLQHSTSLIPTFTIRQIWRFPFRRHKSDYIKQPEIHPSYQLRLSHSKKTLWY